MRLSGNLEMQRGSGFWLRRIGAAGRRFFVVDASVEVADGSVEEKFKFEVGHGRQPLFEGALFAVAADVGPVVKDEYGAVGEAGPEIVQAIESGLVNVAINADVAKFAGNLRIRAAQAFFKESFDQLEPRSQRCLNVFRNLLERASVLALFPERQIVLRVGIGKTLETVEAVDPPVERELFRCPAPEINPPTLKDAEFHDVALDILIA